MSSPPASTVMSDLATFAMDAHGGLDRWRRFKTVSAHLLQGGAPWGLKGQDGKLNDVHVTVDLRTESASHWPFVGRIYQPVLVVCGSDDTMLPDRNTYFISSIQTQATARCSSIRNASSITSRSS